MIKALVFASSLMVAIVSVSPAASAHSAAQPVPSAEVQGRIRLPVPGAAVERLRLKPYLETARLRLKPYVQTARRLNPQPLPPVSIARVSLDA